MAIALIHSSANVLNDYFDARNGTDMRNTSRVFPFTGGSRFIQNAVLNEEETRALGIVLFLSGAALGVFIAAQTGPWLLLIGALGAGLAVFYSAPPCLACKGLGDMVIAVCFGVLPIVGVTYVLMGEMPVQAWWLGAAIGCFVAAILWVNSIPDIEADHGAGKHTLPARLGADRAAMLLPAWFLLGFVLLAVAPLPFLCNLALLAGVPAVLASRALLREQFIPGIPMTLITHAAVCIFLVAGLLFDRLI